MSLPSIKTDGNLRKYLSFISGLNNHCVLTNLKINEPGLNVKNINNLSDDLDTYKDNKVYLILSYKKEEDIVNVSRLVTSRNQIYGICMFFYDYLVGISSRSTEKKDVSLLSDFKLSAWFPNLTDVVISNEYYFTCSRKTTIDYISLEESDIDQLLWTPVDLPNYIWHDLVQKKQKKKKDNEPEQDIEYIKELLPGLHYIIKQLNLNQKLQTDWVNRINTVLYKTKKTLNLNSDKNLYLYDTILKYILWENDSNKFLNVPNGVGTYKHKEFLLENMYESACTYFSRFLEYDTKMLEKLCILYKQNPGKLFYFTNQYSCDITLFNFLYEIEQPKPLVLALFDIPYTQEFIDYNKVNYITPFLLGKALTYVVRKEMDRINALEKSVKSHPFVFNEFIHNQMIRLSLKLKPFLDKLHKSLRERSYVFDNKKLVQRPHNITRHELITIMDNVFECNFLEYTNVSLENIRQVNILLKNDPPLLPNYIKKDGENYDMIMSVLYQYALHAYLMIHDLMKERGVNNPKPHEVELYMKAIRENRWYKSPSTRSNLFPYTNNITGLLFEAFLEYSIVCMDLQDIALPPNEFLSMLLPFLFEESQPTNMDFMKDVSPALEAKWISPSLVHKMYIENDIPISMDHSKQMYNILMNIIDLYKYAPYNNLINKFTRQFSGRKNIIPTEILENNVVPSNNKETDLLKEQLKLREQSIPVELHAYLDDLAKFIKQDVKHRDIAMNRANRLVSFNAKLPRHVINVEKYKLDQLLLNKYKVNNLKSEQDKENALYEMYENHNALLLNETELNEIMLLLTQLYVSKVRKLKNIITINSVSLLLDSMNENNLISVHLFYSIMNKILSESNLSKEDYDFINKIRNHIKWALDSGLSKYLFGEDLQLVNYIEQLDLKLYAQKQAQHQLNIQLQEHLLNLQQNQQ